MAENKLSVPGLVRKAGLALAGQVEVPFLGNVGFTSQAAEEAFLRRAGFKLVQEDDGIFYWKRSVKSTGVDHA